MGLSIHHIAMRTRGLARLERFYVDVLGLPVVRRDIARGSVWLGAGHALLMLERSQSDEPRVPRRSAELVAFAVENTEPWRARLAKAGVEIEAETRYTLYFRDPDGRRIGVSAFPPPGCQPAPTVEPLHLREDM
jgi:glyoxylase I family protein